MYLCLHINFYFLYYKNYNILYKLSICIIVVIYTIYMQTLLRSSTLKILIYMYNITVKVLNVNKFFKNFINEFYKKKNINIRILKKLF